MGDGVVRGPMGKPRRCAVMWTVRKTGEGCLGEACAYVR